MINKPNLRLIDFIEKTPHPHTCSSIGNIHLETVLDTQSGLSKFKKKEIIQSRFSEGNRNKLGINHKRISEKSQTFENQTISFWIIHGSKKKSEDTLGNVFKWVTMKTQHIKICEKQVKHAQKKLTALKKETKKSPFLDLFAQVSQPLSLLREMG